MTTKEFRIVMTFSVSAFLLLLGLFGLVAFKVDLFAPPAVQAATYTLSPTYTYTSTVPGLLSYQGFLADGDGNPLTGNYQMTFAVYSTTVEGIPPLWTETDAEVVVRAGEFSVLLGDETPFPENLFAQPDRYLGVQVEGNPEMTPRQRFASVAFALNAYNAEISQEVSTGPRLTVGPVTDYDKIGASWTAVPSLTLTAPESGLYLIMATTIIRPSTADANRYAVGLAVNDALIDGTYTSYGGGASEDSTVKIFYDVALSQGDTVEMLIYSYVGTQRVWGNHTYLRMIKVSTN